MQEPYSKDDTNFRREEDRKWRERTEERLVGLISSESVQNDRLDEIDEELRAFRFIIDGKPDDKHDNGIKGEIHDLAKEVNELTRLMRPDHLGHGGILSIVKDLLARANSEDKHKEHFWTFSRAVVVAVITLLGVALANLDKISSVLNSKRTDPIGIKIHETTHPKPRYKRIKAPVLTDQE